MNSDQAHYQFGVELALANRGMTKSAYFRMVGQHEALESAEGDIYQRELCKIAACAFHAAGDITSVHGQLFTKLAASGRWCEAYNRFSRPVARAIGRMALERDALAKEASAAALVPFAADKAGVPAVMKLLLGLGAVGGVGAGSLGFLLSRDARQTTAENNALLERTRAYKQLAKEIKEDMDNEGILEQQQTQDQPRRYAL